MRRPTAQQTAYGLTGLGIALVVAGVALVSVPAALIVAGLAAGTVGVAAIDV